MMLRDLHDRAYVYVDGELKKTFDVMKPDGLIKRIMKKDGLLLNLKNEETELGILVDAMGRVNYGEHLMDRKGISAVNLNLQTVMDYEVTTLPLDNIEKLDFLRQRLQSGTVLEKRAAEDALSAGRAPERGKRDCSAGAGALR